MGNTNAESTNKSLIPLAGSSLQHSVQDVAPHSTPTEDVSSKKRWLVLMALFQALLDNTMSPDVRELSIGAACGRLRGVMDEVEVERIARKLMSIRRGNIMDSMF